MKEREFFGIYFELDLIKKELEHFSCCNNLKCNSYNKKRPKKYVFCPICASKLEPRQKTKHKRPLSIKEICKKTGISYEIEGDIGIVNCDICDIDFSDYSKYFVFEYHVGDIMEDDISKNLSKDEALNSEKENPRFLNVVNLLEKTFGSKFKVHYGNYTVIS